MWVWSFCRFFMPQKLVIQNFHIETNQGHVVNHDGRDFYAVPVVALVAGVVNGELAPASEIGKYPDAWAGITVPMGHPMRNGQAVSANSPQLVEKALGRFWNPVFEDNRLKGEIWLDIKRITNMGGRALKVYREIKAGELHEVSTAYFRDLEPTEGTFNGEPYVGIQRNIRPDHLAILADEIVACSNADGCGVPRTNKERQPMNIELKQIPTILKKWVLRLAPGYRKNESLNARLEKIRDAFIDINTAPNGDILVWPVDVYENVVIGRQGGDYWAYDYTVNEQGDVEFSNPVQVKKAVSYLSFDGGDVIANSDTTCYIGSFDLTDLTENADQDDRINEIQENETMPEETTNNNTVTTQQGQGSLQAAPVTNAAPDTPVTTETAPDGRNTANEGMVTLQQAGDLFDQKLNAIFEPYGGVQNALATLKGLQDNEAAQKTRLIKTIVANERNVIPETALTGLSVEVLTGILKSIQPVNYVGLSPVQFNADDGDPDYMEMPAALAADQVQA